MISQYVPIGFPTSFLDRRHGIPLAACRRDTIPTATAVARSVKRVTNVTVRMTKASWTRHKVVPPQL